MDSVTNKSTDEAKKKPLSSKTGAFFWSVLFLIQENVCNRTQFESTLQLLQDFFAFRVKFSENKSVTTSKPVICLKIRQLFNRNFLNVVKKTAICIPLKEGMSLDMRDYHAKILSLIDVIDEYLPADKIRMNIQLFNHISPPVGSGIAKMFIWGSEDQMEIDKFFLCRCLRIAPNN